MGKRRSDAAKEEKIDKKVAKPKSEFYQGYLPDGDGGDMKPKRIREIDDAAAEFLDARDQVAVWTDAKTVAGQSLKLAIQENEIGGKYYFDHNNRKYSFAVGGEPRVLCEVVKEDV